MKFIDPHVHLFALDQGQYHWLRPENPPHWPFKADIARTYTEDDLLHQSASHAGNECTGPAGYVHIEAGFDNARPWREIDYLEANNTGQLVLRTVACVDLLANDFDQCLVQLGKRNSVVGVRHILDDRVLEVLSQPRVIERLNQVAEKGWLFELQYRASDARATDKILQTLSRVPSLRVVLNHGGLPDYNEADFQLWLANMKKLGHSQMAVKLSGWEMLDGPAGTPGEARVLKIIGQVLECFAKDRVMMASNFPLSNAILPYQALWQWYQGLLPSQLMADLTYHNAYRIYAFNKSHSQVT